MSDTDKIMKVLNKLDPEGLIRIGSPRDEYNQEAVILLHRVINQPLTAEYVRDVWLVQFASGEAQMHTTHRHRRGYSWVGDMPMRPVFGQVAERVNALFPRRS